MAQQRLRSPTWGRAAEGHCPAWLRPKATRGPQVESRCSRDAAAPCPPAPSRLAVPLPLPALLAVPSPSTCWVSPAPPPRPLLGSMKSRALEAWREPPAVAVHLRLPHALYRRVGRRASKVLCGLVELVGVGFRELYSLGVGGRPCWEGSGLLHLPRPALLCGASGPGGRGTGCWQLRVRLSADVLTAHVHGTGAPGLCGGNLVPLSSGRGGSSFCFSWRPARCLCQPGSCQPPRARRLEPPREPCRAASWVGAAGAGGWPAGGGRTGAGPPGGAVGRARTGLWVISVLGMAWLPQQCGLSQGLTSGGCADAREADLGSAPGAGSGAGSVASDRWLCAGQGNPDAEDLNVSRPSVLLRLLIQAGCELSVQDHDGWTPLPRGCALGA